MRIDQAAWKRHRDDANSVMIWAHENLSPDGKCIYYQAQDVQQNKARRDSPFPRLLAGYKQPPPA
jgi:hypothetical protein